MGQRYTRAKGMELTTKLRTMVRSAERRAQASRDPRAEIGFRARSGDVHPAVDQPVDQCADDFSAIDHFAAFAADIRREPVEMDDLTIEEDHGDFRPGFMVNGWATTSSFRNKARCSHSDPLLRHGYGGGPIRYLRLYKQIVGSTNTAIEHG